MITTPNQTATNRNIEKRSILIGENSRYQNYPFNSHAQYVTQIKTKNEKKIQKIKQDN